MSTEEETRSDLMQQLAELTKKLDPLGVHSTHERISTIERRILGGVAFVEHEEERRGLHIDDLRSSVQHRGELQRLLAEDNATRVEMLGVMRREASAWESIAESLAKIAERP